MITRMEDPRYDSSRRIGILIRTLWPGSFARISIEEGSKVENEDSASKFVIPFSAPSTGYSYQDLIESHQTVVTHPNLPGFAKWLSRSLLRQFVPPIRGSESVVPGFELLYWGVADRSRFDFLYCEDQLVGFGALLRRFFRGTEYFVFLAEPLSHIEGIRVLRAARGPLTTSVLHTTIKWLEGRILSSASGLFFVSENTRRRLNFLFPELQHSNQQTLYPGCHPDPRGPTVSHARGYILSVSKWDLGRRPAIGAEIARLTSSEVILAGSWISESAQRDFAAEVKQAPLLPPAQLTLTGALSEEELTDLYRRAFVYLHWNPEGFGMGVIDALAAGVPVVCTELAGSSELIEDGVNGIVVHGETASAFASPLRELATDLALRNRLAQGAWRTAKEHSWKTHNSILWARTSEWSSPSRNEP